MNATTEIAPGWLKDSAETRDISDLWAQTAGNWGEVCTAHFAYSWQVEDDFNPYVRERVSLWRDLIGATVEGNNFTRHLSRFDLTRTGIDCTKLDGWVK